MEEPSFDDIAVNLEANVTFQDSSEDRPPIAPLGDGGGLQARRKRLESILEKQRLKKELLDYYDQ